MDEVISIIVSFNPNIERLKKVISPISINDSKIVIVDNHSENFPDLKSALGMVNVDYIELEQNVGISKALNIGIKYIKNHFNPEWILLLDQDTIVSDDYPFYLIQHIKKGVKDFDKCYIIRGNSDLTKRKESIIKFRTEILSGNLVRSSVFDYIQFREDFFMDFVDTDFFRKVAHLKFLCLKDLSIVIDHSLGVKKNILGKEINYENSNRFYYMIRNSTILFAEYPLDIKVIIAAYKNFLPIAVNEGFLKTCKILYKGIYSALGYLIRRDS